MKVLALDLSSRTGFAYGDSLSGAKPIIGVWDIRSEYVDLIPGNLAYQMRLLFKEHGAPDFLALEKTLHPSVQPSGKIIQAQERQHGAALGVAGIYRIPRVLEVAPATVRAHFLGRANAGDRKSTKAAVIKQAALLGYDVATDDNRADAAALWDYIVHVVCRVPPKVLTLT